MFYKIKYLFDPRLVLKFKSDNDNDIISEVWDKVCCNICAERLIKCEVKYNEFSVVVCNAKDLSQDQIEQINSTIFKNLDLPEDTASIEEVSAQDVVNQTELSQADKEYLLQFADGDPVKSNERPSQPSRANQSFGLSNSSSSQEDIFQSVNSLIGMDELKSWVKDFKAFTNLKLDPARIAKPALSMSYLVSVNSGNGCSTIFDVMGKVVARIIGKKYVEVVEIDVEPNVDSKTYNVHTILEGVSNIEETSNKLYVFALKIDKFQNNNHMSSWIELLSGLRKNQKALFIFVLPYLESMAINDMHVRISDILPNRVLTIRPFRAEEYKQFFKLYFRKLEMSITEDALDLVPDFIAQEKTDGRFYGIDTIYKICDELLYEKLKLASSDSDISTITRDDALSLLKKISFSDSHDLSGKERLDELVSLNEVKNRLKEIVASLKMQKAMDTTNKMSMHMMFSGPPGTGKTIVARILGQILREENLLSAGGFYEVTRKDLVGSYVGHTAPKTAEVCHLARGSVLFIDEAYSLDGGSQNDFGKEAISTLIAEMENNRDDFVVIFAGYEKDLEKLFELNQGLRDRIPHRVNFSNYNRDELCTIFYKMLPKSFSYNDNFREVVDDFFKNLEEDIISSPNFSNARFVRNLTERVLSKAALRMQMNSNDQTNLELTVADFSLAITDSEFKNAKEQKRRPMGFQ